LRLLFTHPDKSLATFDDRSEPGNLPGGIGALGSFLTALSLELDHADRILRGVSMGHPPLLLVRNGSVRLFPEPAGPGWNLPAGVDGLVEMTAQETRMEPGDKLVLYTDGLIEMPTRRKAGRIRPQELAVWTERLLEGAAQQPVSRLTRRLLAAVAGQCGETVVPGGENNTSADDVTLVGVELEQIGHWEEAVFTPANVQELETVVASLLERLAVAWGRGGSGTPKAVCGWCSRRGFTTPGNTATEPCRANALLCGGDLGTMRVLKYWTKGRVSTIVKFRTRVPARAG
jgi:hypothetical protein